MKFLIVGLGNPGNEYEETRHNAGFKVLDELATELTANWEPVKHGMRADGMHKGRKLILLKPNTFMNLSGKAVSYWMQQEKIALQNILIITDDLALPTGKLRLKGKGSDGGHNGLKSINESLGTNQYARLRFGVGNDFFPGKQVEYVLGKWDESERNMVQIAFKKAADGAKLFATQPIGIVMTQMNAAE